MSERADFVWQDRRLARKLLDGVRSGIPLATEQLEVLHRVVIASGVRVVSFLDLGCGDGNLGRLLLTKFPESRGVFVDFSKEMLEECRSRLVETPGRSVVVESDFGEQDWVRSVKQHAPFDVIVSGFAIHHSPDDRKKALYEEIYGLLKPSGLFLNLEHVASSSQWGTKAFDDLMIDSLFGFHRETKPSETRDSVAADYVARPDQYANILAPMETQCQWLRQIGFVDVDCFLKVLELALFGGRRKQ